MALQGSYFRTVGIFLTRHCPLECQHCAVAAGPEHRDKVPIDRVDLWVDRISEVRNVERISVSGGEPFSDLTLLSKVIASANRKGLIVAVLSSGFWATDKRRAKRLVESLPFFSTLEISADEFHEPFVPLERIRFAAEAALERGAGVIIRLTQFKNARFKSRLLKSLGDVVDANVEILETRVDDEGRAAQNSLAPPVTLTSKLPEGNCRWMGTPVVRYDGNVMACCNCAYLYDTGHALWLGNLNDKRFVDMYREANGNLLLQSLRTMGPKAIFRIAQENGLNLEPRMYKRKDICDLCKDIVSSRDTCKQISTMLDTRIIRNEIATKRFLGFGEVMPN